MNQARHSTGPWSAIQVPDRGVWNIYASTPDAMPVATVTSETGSTRGPRGCIETSANALLIKEAPGMLAVLRDVAALLPVAGRLHPDDLRALHARVLASIAAAGGDA